MIALEIETGEGYKKHKKKLAQKFDTAKRKYKNNLYIILTNKDYRERYRNNFKGISILLRTEIETFLSSQFKTGKKYVLRGKN